MKKKSEFDVISRLEKLEAKASQGGYVPGTTLQRTCGESPADAIGWVLAIGPMGGEKAFFYNKDIQSCILSAEEFFQLKGKRKAPYELYDGEE